MKKKVLSILLAATMAATMLTGCGGDTPASATDESNPVVAEEGSKEEAAETTEEATEATEEEEVIPENTVVGDASAEGAFVIWGWNDDIKKILDGPFKEAYPDLYEKIVFVNTGGSDYYQTKVDAMFEEGSGELYPDLMGLEVDYVLKYVNGPFLQSVADLGIEASEYSNMYQYNLDLGSDVDGNAKALFWQATPGGWQIRADLAEKFLGTTDAKELQDKYFSSWDKVVAAAEAVNEASGGMCKLLSGYDDIFRVFSNSRTTGWYDENDVIQVDDNMYKYMDVAKELYDNKGTFNTTQWKDDWSAQKNGDGEKTETALAYTGCPWYTYWCLTDEWNENTILVEGPQQFYWGGTGLAATANCSDPDMAATIMRFFTCETDSMVSINALNSDFVNNKVAIDQILASDAPDDGNGKMFGGQSFLKFYLPSADGIDASTATAEDQIINNLFNDQVKEYAMGKKDKETAIADFMAKVHDTYSYLSVQ